MRQATPDLLAAQPAPQDFNLVQAMTAAPLAAPLRYDYASLGEAGPAIRQHALAIKAADRRMAEATIDAGLHLLAVKASMPHGHWLTWLADEFGMSDDAAERMMNVARRFGSNSATLRNLNPSVLALLAAKSVPDAAVQAAIAAAEVSPVTVTAAKAIIALHRPARCRKCHRTLTDPTAAANGIGACCAAKLVRGAAMAEAASTSSATEGETLPEWVTVDAPDGETVAVVPWFVTEFNDAADSTLAPSPAPPQGESAPQGESGIDPRAAALARLAARLEGLREEMRQLGDEYGKITGDFTTPLEIRHKIEKMQVQVKANQGGWE